MRVGWIGLGKLGFPCALVLAQHHEVIGYDVSERPWDIISGAAEPMREAGLTDLLAVSKGILRAGSTFEVVEHSDVVFVAVQTPHEPRYGGERPMPEFESADFDYSFLVQACREVCHAAKAGRKNVTMVIVSTVLPGTINRVIRPLLNSWVSLAYSPQFIAMGTTIADFTNPEFVICGSDDRAARDMMLEVLGPVQGRGRLFWCDIITAESIKVLYNTFISMKIVWANHVMELAHKTGADCDKVVDALELATDRVISPKYMRGGMGDGGACHPRDLIAMAWLEERVGMSTYLFSTLARSREYQTGWLASLVRHHVGLTGYPVMILGRAYKPGSDLTDGSPALLLASYLEDLSPRQWDPHTVNEPLVSVFEGPMIYVIATMHAEFTQIKFHDGSIVIDPFGYIPDQGERVTVIRVGRQG